MTHDEFKLAEECAEVQRRIFKLLQFGPLDAEPGFTQTDDVRAVLRWLDARNQKLEKFLKLSERDGKP